MDENRAFATLPNHYQNGFVAHAIEFVATVAQAAEYARKGSNKDLIM
jgi:hypothetical protein